MLTVLRVLLRRPRLCEACRVRPARRRNPFCSTDCAKTYYLYL
ncbi:MULTISPECIES: hypothetical protein [unclassified Rathayibacter]|nr:MULTISPECIES: hypothetical protein [unclassified Rathayibacter]